MNLDNDFVQLAIGAGFCITMILLSQVPWLLLPAFAIVALVIYSSSHH